MARFILFVYDRFYPAGARNDEHGRFNNLNECIIAAKEKECDFCDILDIETGKWVDIVDLTQKPFKQ